MYPEPIKKISKILSDFPGIGPRQAIRIAFYLANQGKHLAENLEDALEELQQIKICKECFSSFEFSKGENGFCSICKDKSRKDNIIAILEKETDLISLEKTKDFKGKYLVLGEISKDGILKGEQKLRLNSLKERLNNNQEKIEEIILAINPGTLGDIESSLLFAELKNFTHKISRLGRGLPTGGEIEFADDETLKGALENRR